MYWAIWLEDLHPALGSCFCARKREIVLSQTESNNVYPVSIWKSSLHNLSSCLPRFRLDCLFRLDPFCVCSYKTFWSSLLSLSHISKVLLPQVLKTPPSLNYNVNELLFLRAGWLFSNLSRKDSTLCERTELIIQSWTLRLRTLQNIRAGILKIFLLLITQLWCF